VRQAPHSPDGVLPVAETIFENGTAAFESKQSRSRVSEAQFIAKDFKEFIRLAGLPHVKTSPLLPADQRQNSDGTRASSSIVSGLAVRSQEQDAARLIERFVNYYNTARLHSAIGYVTPADRLAGRHLEIFSERDRKLELARQNRKTKRQSLTKSIIASTS
jgi:putative transposase